MVKNTWGGYCFFIVQFAALNKAFLIDACTIDFHQKQKRKSIPLAIFSEHGQELQVFSPRINYLDAVDKLCTTIDFCFFPYKYWAVR